MYEVTKIFSGLTCCFRQWRSDSHCKYLHGYALKFKITFGCHQLNEKNWVVDFGSLQNIKNYISDLYDHTTIVSNDDPLCDYFLEMKRQGAIQLIFMDKKIGCEAFAERVADFCNHYIKHKTSLRAFVVSVECIENETNSAIFKPNNHA